MEHADREILPLPYLHCQRPILVHFQSRMGRSERIDPRNALANDQGVNVVRAFVSFY